MAGADDPCKNGLWNWADGGRDKGRLKLKEMEADEQQVLHEPGDEAGL